MKLLLWTRDDPASMRVARALVDQGFFPEDSAEGYLRLDRDHGAALGRVEGSLLTADFADRAFSAPRGDRFERALFLSKHSAASGKTSFTVHPIGNPGPSTDFGGAPRTLAPPDGPAQTSILRALAREADHEGVSATFEATHHGPRMELPSAFVEVGSTAPDWDNERFCAAVARAVVGGYLKAPLHVAAPVALGLGGSHYQPRQTDLARKDGAVFGHLLPAYALAAIDEATLVGAATQSRATTVAVDRRVLPDAVDRACALLERAGFPLTVLGS